MTNAEPEGQPVEQWMIDAAKAIIRLMMEPEATTRLTLEEYVLAILQLHAPVPSRESNHVTCETMTHGNASMTFTCELGAAAGRLAEHSAPKCRHCGKVLGNHFVKERKDAANPSCNESITGTTFEVERRVGERRKGGRREFSDCCWAGTSKNRRSSRDRRSGKERRAK